MSELQNCENCAHKDGCKEVYRRMSQYDGPSVLGRVFCAFVIPLLSFIISLGVLQYMFEKSVSSENQRIFFSFLGALIVTLMVITAIGVVNRKFGKYRQRELCH